MIGQKHLEKDKENRKKENEEKMKDALDQIKKIADILGVKLEIVHFKKDFDADERIEKIKKILEREGKFVINITGGPKFDSFILYIISLLYPQKILDIVYVREDIGELVILPKIVLSINLTEFEKQLLLEIKKEKQPDPKKLAAKMKRPLPQILRYLKKLEAKGLIEREKHRNKLIKIKAPLFV